MEAFIENSEIFAQIKQVVENALESIKIRVGWRKNNEQDVAVILGNYGKEDENSEMPVYLQDINL